MKLYTGDLSPYSAKVRIQIYAMGISDDITFDLPIATFYQGKFKDISPIGRIPVLETDEGIIPESEVIAEYLDELYPEKSLMQGKTLKEKADIRVISRIADTYLMNNIFMALSQLDPSKRNEAVIDLLMGQVERGMAALEKHINADGFATGTTLSRADASLAPALFMRTPCHGLAERAPLKAPPRSKITGAAFRPMNTANAPSTRCCGVYRRAWTAQNKS